MDTGEIDTTRPLVVTQSSGKLVLYALGSAAFVAAGLWLVNLDDPVGRRSIWEMQVVGYLSIAFFGATLLLVLGRLFTASGPVLTLSAAGFRDERVSTDIVPWRAIARIGTWEFSGQRIIVLGLHPGEEQKLRLASIASWTRRANATLGADGLSISSQGTRISHDALLAAITAFARRYGNN